MHEHHKFKASPGNLGKPSLKIKSKKKAVDVERKALSSVLSITKSNQATTQHKHSIVGEIKEKQAQINDLIGKNIVKLGMEAHL